MNVREKNLCGLKLHLCAPLSCSGRNAPQLALPGASILPLPLVLGAHTRRAEAPGPRRALGGASCPSIPGSALLRAPLGRCRRFW